MKIGFNVFLLPLQVLAGVARKADELGFESIWISDHLIWPKEIRTVYPYEPNPYTLGRVGPHTPLLDPFVTLSYIAAITSRVRLGIGVYILPLRNPLVTARAAVTVDVLSGGRLLLGIGMGWMEEEFTIAGEDFGTRVKRAEECVQVLKALWTQQEPEFHGRFFDFGPAKFEPKPVQRPHPPIVLGGESEAALRRTAMLGDGWYGIGGACSTPESAARRVERLRQLRREAGRENEPFEISVSPGGRLTLDDIARFQEAGVDRLLVSPWSGGDEIEDLERFAHEVLHKLPFL